MLGLASQDTQHLKDSKLISPLSTMFTEVRESGYSALEEFQTYLPSLNQIFSTMLGLASQDTQHLKNARLISTL
jgi:hypothetical protein